MKEYVGISGVTLRYAELEDCNQFCVHCGAKILAQDAGFGNYLAISPITNEPSFHCDPSDMSKPHSPKAN